MLQDLIHYVDGQDKVSVTVKLYNFFLHNAVKRKTNQNNEFHICTCTIQVLGKAVAGDAFGEIGVLYYRPQPFTVRTTELSQILRLSRTSLMNSIQANMEDGRIVMNNLFRVSITNGQLLE